MVFLMVFEPKEEQRLEIVPISPTDLTSEF